MTITPVTAPPGGGKEEGGRDRWTPEPYWLAILGKSMSFIFDEGSGLSEGTLYVCVGSGEDKYVGDYNNQNAFYQFIHE